jgi:mono/diheme cytochrome c family protein
MSFLRGAIASLFAMALLGGLLAWSGTISVAADHYGPLDVKLDTLLNGASRASIRRHASTAKNPLRGDPSAAAAGLLVYRESCLSCHGAARVRAAKFAVGLNPGAPALESKEIQAMSDGELFWVVSHGIRATGMPAFSAREDPDDIWRIVAFLRRLPRLSDDEIRQLQPLDRAVRDESWPHRYKTGRQE